MCEILQQKRKKKIQACFLKQLDLIYVYLSCRDSCSGSENGRFPSSCPKLSDLRQDLCVKSPSWSCWEMSKAMQLMGPSVKLINLESIAITLGSQPNLNMVLCPLSQPLSSWLTRRQSSPVLNPVTAFSWTSYMEIWWETKIFFLFLPTLCSLLSVTFFPTCFTAV